MRTTQDLISHNETAKKLGITPRWLTGLVRQGAILPAQKGGKIQDNLYRPAEVNALRELRRQAVDLPSVAGMAVQARSLSQATAARLDMLCRFLGITSTRLSIEEEDMFQLHLRAVRALQGDFYALRANDVIDWATTLGAIDEAYLGAVEYATETRSPWAIYLQLANELAQKRSMEADSDLSLAYACLDSSRRSLRHVAYFYVLSRDGKRQANRMFTDHEGIDEVIAQLFPNSLELHGSNPLADTLEAEERRNQVHPWSTGPE